MTPADGEALKVLFENSPDTGKIQIAPHYRLDAYTASTVMYNESVGIVAEANDGERLVGAGFISFGRCQFEGVLRDYAALKGLVVHPDYRRQGLATELAARRVEYARGHVGENGILVATLQENNEGSFAVARKWSQQIKGELRNGIVKMRTAFPEPTADLSVRQATVHDMDATARHLNVFYQNYNFYEPHTGESLTNWLQQTPLDTVFRHYYLVTDSAGNLLAGLGLVEQHRLVGMRVDRMPATIKLLNRLVRLVPVGGQLRQLSATKIWFISDQIEAARFLWETIRWEWKERANTLTYVFDPRSPLKEVSRAPFWMPQARFTLAVNGPVPMSEERLIYPI